MSKSSDLVSSASDFIDIVPRWWVHNIFKKRKEQGAYHNLVQEMLLTDNTMLSGYQRNTAITLLCISN